MDKATAKEILSALAEGVNPITGEILPAEDSCNQVEVVRAIYVVLRSMEAEPPAPSVKKRLHAGDPWTAEEELQLIDEFQSGMTGYKMAQTHGRTQRGISARLVKLGLIEQRNQMK